ncbi:MAG: hypothetical protein U9Q27_03565, partial [Patescibacteria group bacterium]|nr:hypothetical protein [Patescibacteria group bacterium]
MRKASFKVTNAGSNSTAHNSRTNPPKYLIEDIGYNDNYYDLKYSDEEYLKLSELKYLSKNNQKMQERQKVALIKETVLNLKDHHTEKDVEKLFKKLNEKYGGHKITELSIHRDEGHFEKDGIAYYPTKHILQKDGDWYIVPLDKFLDDDFKPTKNDFSEKVKIDDFQKIKNYHAHVKFSMFDLGTGITGRMTKGQVSERLKVVSKELGLAYKPKEKINSGKAINHIKDQHDLNRRSQIKQLFLNKKLNKQTAKKEELKVTTKELKATTKDLQSEIKTLRKDLSGQGLNKEDFKKVNELNKELKVQIENKKIDVNTLEIRLKKLKEELLQKDKLVNSITTNSPIENALLSASS